MKAINYRALVVVLVGVVLLAIGIPVLHRLQTVRTASVYLEKARAAREEKDFGDAAEMYVRYVNLVPGDTDAQAEYGLLLADLALTPPGDARRLGQAFGVLESVLRTDAKRQDESELRRRLAEVAVQMRRYQDAREQIDKLIKLNPEDGSLYWLRGKCQAATGEEYSAYVSYRDAIAKSSKDSPKDNDKSTVPDRLLYYFDQARLAHYLIKNGKTTKDTPVEAPNVWLARMVQDYQKVPLAYTLRGNYLLLNRDPLNAEHAKWLDNAAADAAKALQIEPDNLEGHLLAARVWLEKAAQGATPEQRQQALAQAQKHAERGIQLQPRAEDFYMVLADAERMRGSPDKAISYLQAGIDANAEHPSFRALWGMAQLLLEKKDLKPEALKAVIEKLPKAMAEAELTGAAAEARLSYLEGRLNGLQQRWQDACEKLQKACAGLSQGKADHTMLRDAHYWLGYAYSQIADSDETWAKAASAFRQASKIDPNWLLPRLGAAHALASLKNGSRLDEAIEEQQKAVRLPKAPPAAWLQLADWMIRRNQRLERSQQDWTAVETVLSQVEKAIPNSAEVAMLRAQALGLQGRAADAEKNLLEARNRNPNQPESWLLLVSLAVQKKDWKSVEKYLDEAQQKLGDSIHVRLARANYLATRYGKESLPRLRELAENVDRFSAEEQATLRSKLAEYAMRFGDLALARTMARLVADKHPGNLPIRLLEFEAALRQQDRAGMDKLLSEIGGIPGNEAQALALVGKAIQLQQGEPRENGNLSPESDSKALEYLNEARKLLPTWSRIPFLIGAIEDRLGHQDAALNNYREAIKLGESDPRVAQQALQILYARQDFAAAETLIEQLRVRPEMNSPDVDRMIADISLRQGNLGRGLAKARDLAKDSKEYRDYVILGQALVSAAQQSAASAGGEDPKALLQEAEKAIRQANQLAPESPVTWIALIRYLVLTERKEEAEKAIAQISSKVPPNQLALTLAQCYEAVGKLQEAAQNYEAALAKFPNDMNLVRQAVEFFAQHDLPSMAQSHLEKIVDGQNVSSEDRAWARRRLASVLQTLGGAADRRRAIELVDANLKLDPQSKQDLRIKANLLASAPDSAAKEQAKSILAELVKNPATATSEDRFRLAQVYLELDKDANWSEARKLLQEISADPKGTDPRYLAAYVSALIGQKEVATADDWLKKLDTLAPDSLLTARLQAELSFASGRYADIASALKAFPAKAKQPQDRAIRLLSVANVLHDFAKRLANSPNQAAADKLIQEANACVEETLQLMESAKPKMDVGLLVALTGPMVGANPQAAQLQRLKTALESARDKSNPSVPLLLAIADVSTMQERFDEVESLYREVLRLNKDDLVALNNLAVLLALRGKNLDEAQQLIDRAIKSVDGDPTLLDSRAVVLLARKQPQDALRDLEAAIKATPRPTRYFHQTQAYLMLAGEGEKAAEAWKQANEMKLTRDLLHPLERGEYDKLKTTLGAGAAKAQSPASDRKTSS